MTKKNNATGFETNVAAVFETNAETDNCVVGETGVGDAVADSFADFFTSLLTGVQPARAGPLIEATCCKTSLGNDSILVEPGAWIIGSAGDFVNQTRPQIRDSFLGFVTARHNDLILHTIPKIARKNSPPAACI